jgi:Holliday junction resolvasome RuvABC DNA-binding subunit
MSETPVKIVVNCETGEQEIIPLTAEEIAQREADALAYAEQQAAIEVENAKKAQDRADAIAALTGLGLTEDQINALVG